MRIAKKSTKEKFILAALNEIQLHGISDFSIRRVATRCGTTSGAPYRHFKDKNELIIEVLRYVNTKWYTTASEYIESFEGDLRDEIIGICILYIKFLCLHPEFQTIITLNDKSMSPEQKVEKARISELSRKLIDKYCESVNMSNEVRRRKTYAVLSFIYGAALMINSGYMPFNETTIEIARKCIDREFDLT